MAKSTKTANAENKQAEASKATEDTRQINVEEVEKSTQRAIEHLIGQIEAVKAIVDQRALEGTSKEEEQADYRKYLFAQGFNRLCFEPSVNDNMFQNLFQKAEMAAMVYFAEAGKKAENQQ